MNKFNGNRVAIHPSPESAEVATGVWELYAQRIARLPRRTLTPADLMIEAFLLERDGDLSVYYIPFGRPNTDARVVLIGITPGFTEMRLAYEVARKGLEHGLRREEILERVGRTASFAGQMRTNLNRMLDELGLPGLLGIDRSAQLFADRADLLHSAAACRNPVFVRGNNYSGSAPPIARTPVLRRQILHTLGPELAAVPSAILLPLGRAVQDALEILIAEHLVDPQRCCMGFPHPSGANVHRDRLFAQRRNALTRTLATWFSSSRPALTSSQLDHQADLCSRLA